MVSFADKEMALAACPTYASKCGADKMFNFKSTKFTEYNTANIVIEKPGPASDGTAADCNDIAPENKSVRDRCLLKSDICTYIIKGACLAPGFHTKWDNTMTSNDHVDVQILEWDSKYITYDTSITTRYNTKQYNGRSEG